MYLTHKINVPTTLLPVSCATWRLIRDVCNYRVGTSHILKSFLMCILVVQIEEEFQQLTEIETEEAVVLTVSQKQIKQFIEGLSRIEIHNRKRRKSGRVSILRRNILHKTSP